jgi:hypothetical protein
LVLKSNEDKTIKSCLICDLDFANTFKPFKKFALGSSYRSLASFFALSILFVVVGDENL